MPTDDVDSNIDRRRGRVFIPQDWFKPQYTLEIKYNGDSTYTDITDDCISLTHTTAATVRLQTFRASLDNNMGKYKTKITGGEWIRIKYGYANASSGGVIERFRGRLITRDVSYSAFEGWKMEIGGTSYPEFNEKRITIEFDNVAIETAISQVMAYWTDMSFTPPNLSTDRLTQSFNNETGFTIVRKICQRFQLEFYITPAGVLTLVDSSASQHTDIAIGIGQNLLFVEEWGTDWSQLKNRVKVHGQQESFVTYYKYAEDTSSQSQFWVKEADIFDSSVRSDVEAIQRATAELNITKTIEDSGRVATIGLPTAIPGYQIYLGCPYVVEGHFTIRSCSHRFTDEGYSTHFTLSTERQELAQLFVERIKAEDGLRPPENLAKQTNFAIVIDFQSPTTPYLTFSGTEVLARKLHLETGESSGTCSTASDFPGVTSSANTASCFVVVAGTNVENCTVDVSNNNGLNTVQAVFTTLSTELSFATSDNEHTVQVNLADNDEGAKPVITKVGVYFVET